MFWIGLATGLVIGSLITFLFIKWVLGGLPQAMSIESDELTLETFPEVEKTRGK